MLIVRELPKIMRNECPQVMTYKSFMSISIYFWCPTHKLVSLIRRLLQLTIAKMLNRQF